jgi:hypothetical protein
MCEPGMYSPQAASSGCELCPIGAFNNESGQVACRICKNGTFAPAGSIEVSLFEMEKGLDHAMV